MLAARTSRSLVCLLSLWLCSTVYARRVVADTSFGRLIRQRATTRGDWSATKCERFRGIPYAKPPVGQRRFAKPEPWDEPFAARGRKAKKVGKKCPQAKNIYENNVGSEDCLFLNLWRPRTTRPGDKLVVMVFIYGGSFTSGAGRLPVIGGNVYGGCALASRFDLIVANMNYRVGSLGFAAFKKPDGSITANYGIADQREALRWIQREVGSFGGDPGKVTIFGESAGAISVFHHLASPLSAGLFRGAVSESGMPASVSLEWGLTNTAIFAARVGCTSTDSESAHSCLMDKSVEELISAQVSTRNPFSEPHKWSPVVDGVDLPAPVAQLFLEGKTAPVPLMAGTNTDEGNLFVWPGYQMGMDKAQYRDFVRSMFVGMQPRMALNDAELERVFSMYPPLDEDNRGQAAAVLGDASFTCRSQIFAAEHGKRGTDVFLYRWDDRLDCMDMVAKKALPGVIHLMEVPYVFGTPSVFWCSWSEKEADLSWRTRTMWTNFAKTLNPTPNGAPGHRGKVWPKYEYSNRSNLVMREEHDVVEVDYKGEKCKFWDEILYSRDRPHSEIGSLLEVKTSGAFLEIRTHDF